MSPSILYLHGFCSSPQSWKAKALAEALDLRGLSAHFYCPFLSPVPHLAIKQIEAILANLDGGVTLAGSSLGGLYASWLAEKHDLKAVLINPAVLASLSLTPYLGEQINLHTGEKFELTMAHIEALRELENIVITPERYLLLVETGDELLDYRKAVERYAGARQIIIEGGDHSFTHFNDLIPQLIEFAGL